MIAKLGIARGFGAELLAAAQTSFGEPVDRGGALGCLTFLAGMALLSVVSFAILKIRSFLNRSGKEKADFTSLRSTGKTIVSSSPPAEEDSDPPGGVN